jgi:hypothetical protein
VDTAVTVTVLGELTQLPMEGRVVDMSGSGLRVAVPAPVPYGSAVRIEGDNMLLLGEVLRTQAADGVYEVGVQISHALTSLDELQEMNRAFTGSRA